MRVLLALIAVFAAASVDAAPLPVYADALQSGFENWSWGNAADVDLQNTTPVHAGTHSARLTSDNWNGLQFGSNTARHFVDYQNLTFFIHGGSAGGQHLQVVLNSGGTTVGTYDLSTLVAGGSVAANAWRQVTLDFDSHALTSGDFTALSIMPSVAGSQAPVYVDDVVFNARTTPPPPPPSGASVAVSVVASADVHPIDPAIFGVAPGNSYDPSVGYTWHRWGGNSVTRYNWQGVDHNAGSDWFFLGYGPDQTGSANAFIDAAHAAGAQPLITIPTIGWAPINDAARHWGFSIQKYGPQLATEFTYTGGASWANADAGNGECNPNVNHTGNCVLYDAQHGKYHLINNDPHDTSVAVDATFERAWVHALKQTYGAASSGGIKLYALDNEPMLWNSTHRDVHPNGATYDEIWGKAVSYGAAIKAEDSTAKVTGPVTWGWCDLFGSAADNCLTGSDRDAHGGTPFVLWYLQQVCDYEQAHSIRLVDYLDLHYYPQGGFDESPAGIAARLRSVKELYDPNYVSESWIATLGDDPTWHYTKPNLIPRVKSWIASACPGTKLAITEYNWGADNSQAGAIAQAEVLAIFAREGVDLATRWVAPTAGSLAERGFRIFLNYDGAGARVQGDSVRATSANVDQIGAYAFRQSGQRVMVLLTNKDTVSHDVPLTFDVAHSGTWKLYGFDATHALGQTGTNTIAGTTLTLSALPPMSVSLLVVPDGDVIFANDFD